MAENSGRAFALLVQSRVRISRAGVRVIAARLPMEIAHRIATSNTIIAAFILWHKALLAGPLRYAQGSNQCTINAKVIRAQQWL